jgi:Mn2+/Fe2+ NRAMP family transporter
MKQIILEDQFEFKQKAVLITLSILPLLFILSFFINFNNIQPGKLIFALSMFILSFTLFICFLILTFFKKGIKVMDNEIYFTLSFMGKPFYSKKIDIEDKKIFTILKKNVLQKNSYLSAGGADISYKYLNFEFVALSRNHLIKKHLITLNSLDYVDNLKELLENNSLLKYEVYSPNK